MKISIQKYFSALLPFLILLLFISCNGVHSNDDEIKSTIDKKEENLKPGLLEKYRLSCGRGELLFKNNCAVCHCLTHCEPRGGSLINTIKVLPVDSIQYLIGFIKDSKTMIENGDAFAKKLNTNNSIGYQHDFGKTLSDQNIIDLIAYLSPESNTN